MTESRAELRTEWMKTELEGRRARGQEGRIRGSAKVQSGAELLCKSAKVRLNFQVSGLGSREPGSGVQVRVQVQDLNIARTRTCT
jgi:hypothetical protein